MKFLVICCALAATNLAIALPPATQVNQSEPSQVTNSDNDDLLARFALLYVKQERPRFTILWNAKFDAQISDWELAPTQQKYLSSLQVESNEQNLSSDYQNTLQTLQRTRKKIRYAPSEAKQEAFKTHFIDTILRANVNLVDRSTILRLTAANDPTVKKLHELDSRQIETEALLANTDYLLEVLFVPTQQHSLGFNASVEIKDVQTGQIIAKVISDVPTTTKETVWQATNEGFSRVEQVTSQPTFAAMGEEVAFTMMSKLLAAWQDE